MDRQLASAFIAPTIKHWSSEFGRDLQLASETTRPASFRAGDIVVTLLVSGDLTGEVHYVVDEATAQVVYSALEGKWPEEIDDAVFDKIEGLVREYVKGVNKNLKALGLKAKIRIVGTTLSDGRAMGPVSDIATVFHYFAARPGSGEEDHVRVWIGAHGVHDEVEESANEAIDEPAVLEPTNHRRADLDEIPEFEAPPTPVTQSGGIPDVVQAKRFELLDDDGEVRAVLGSLGNGSPHLILSDGHGRMRAAVALSKSGSPRVLLFDEEGNKTHEAPPVAEGRPLVVLKRRAA